MATIYIHANIDKVFDVDVYKLSDSDFDDEDTTHAITIKDRGGSVKLFLTLDQVGDLANAVNSYIFTQGGKYKSEGDDLFKQWEESNA